MNRSYQRLVVDRFGGTEVLRVDAAPLLPPEAHQVRLRVQAAGVSFADLLMREGIHPEVWWQKPPFTLGWDAAGVVDAVGAAVTGWSVGQRAAALPIKGGCAEYLYLPVTELIPIPAEVSAEAAVCLVFNYATAYQMLKRSARVRAGESALIHSASGGIGTALIELGRLEGLTLFGTASAGKHPLVRDLGCVPIDYRQVDFAVEIQRLTDGRGVDVVFDGIGGAHLRRSYRVLRRGGRLIAFGLTAALSGGRSVARAITRSIWDWALAFAPNLIPDGRSVRLYSIQTLKRLHPDWFREDVLHLFDLAARDALHPIIGARFSLHQAAQAHDLLARGGVTGKIVLQID